jgi:hypothetical protein
MTSTACDHHSYGADGGHTRSSARWRTRLTWSSADCVAILCGRGGRVSLSAASSGHIVIVMALIALTLLLTGAVITSSSVGRPVLGGLAIGSASATFVAVLLVS